MDIAVWAVTTLQTTQCFFRVSAQPASEDLSGRNYGWEATCDSVKINSLVRECFEIMVKRILN